MINLTELRHLFYYEDGILYWENDCVADGRGGYKQSHKAGDPVGSLHSGGYLKVGLFGTTYSVHQLVYWFVTGNMPKMIDHINGIKTDNRFENLREVNYCQNVWNTPLRVTNKSGVKGICWNSKKQRWRVTISANGVTYSLGTYKNFTAAVEVISKARAELHGEYAKHT